MKNSESLIFEDFDIIAWEADCLGFLDLWFASIEVELCPKGVFLATVSP